MWTSVAWIALHNIDTAPVAYHKLLWDNRAVERRKEENDDNAPEGRRKAGRGCGALGGVPLVSLLLVLTRPL